MSAAISSQSGQVQQWVAVRAEPPGHFTVQVVGVPEIKAIGSTREEALEQVRAMLGTWIASGQLVTIDVPNANPILNFPGHLDPNDPLEQEFRSELFRLRTDDLARSLKEEEQECSNSSSTPTT